MYRRDCIIIVVRSLVTELTYPRWYTGLPMVHLLRRSSQGLPDTDPQSWGINLLALCILLTVRHNETQIQTLWTCRNAKMGSQILENLCYSEKLDKCEVNIRYRKYTWIFKRINWLFNFIYQSWYWYGCLHVDPFSNGGWCKQRISGAKFKQVALCNQASKWKLVWSSKYWSIQKMLS